MVKKSDVKICPMSEKDLPAVKAIERACQLSSWTLDDYKKEIDNKDSVAIISVLEGKVCGFLLGRLIMNQNTTNKITIVNEAEIYNIGVNHDLRRLGIGKSLFFEFTIKCREKDISLIWLEVRKNNNDALEFYKSLGFESVNIRKNYYTNPPEDAVIMKHKL